MKQMHLGCCRMGKLVALFSALLISSFSTYAARLQWLGNPEEEGIAFYTVYAESESGIYRSNIVGELSFDLDFLVPNIVYTLYVTATSKEGLESSRSEGITFAPSVPLPVIVSQPASTNVAAGAAITLSAQAASLQSVAYQWLKNGTAIPNAVFPTLTIVGAATSHSGDYSVIVSNINGTVQSSLAHVVVQISPRIVVQPSPAAAPRGARIVLSVGASGTDLNYQWFRSQEPVVGATNETLSIYGIADEDAGNYSVKVSNLINSVQSTAVQISVWEPITIVQQPVGQSVSAGGQLRLSVSATGPTPLKYQWYRGSLKLEGKTSPELTIYPVEPTDAGTYNVRISSEAQTISSASAPVSILYDPTRSECILSLIKTGESQLTVSGFGPANTSFLLQVTEDLSNPSWKTLQSITTDPTGRFGAVLSTAGSGNIFVRTARD